MNAQRSQVREEVIEVKVQTDPGTLYTNYLFRFDEQAATNPEVVRAVVSKLTDNIAKRLSDRITDKELDGYLDIDKISKVLAENIAKKLTNPKETKS